MRHSDGSEIAAPEVYKLIGFTEFDGNAVIPGSEPRYIVDGMWAEGASGNATIREIDLKGATLLHRVVDAHVHTFPTGGPFGLNPYERSLTRGSNLFVDAGSAGVENFSRLREYLDATAPGKYRALINVAPKGLEGGHAGEFLDEPQLSLNELRDTYERNKSVVSGLKLRLSRQFYNSEASARRYLALSTEYASELDLPLMVHIMDPPMEMSDILDDLKPSDIATHIYSDAGTNVLQGRNLDAALAAKQRGVRMDVGCGSGGLDFEVARTAFTEGLKPDYVSSDVTTVSARGPVFGLPHTMAKMLNLGLTVPEVFRAVTIMPQELFAHGDHEPHGTASFCAFASRDGAFEFYNTGFLPQELRTLTGGTTIGDVVTFNSSTCVFGEAAYSQGVRLSWANS